MHLLDVEKEGEVNKDEILKATLLFSDLKEVATSKEKVIAG